jgi:hypothetical protein
MASLRPDSVLRVIFQTTELSRIQVLKERDKCLVSQWDQSLHVPVLSEHPLYVINSSKRLKSKSMGGLL